MDDYQKAIKETSDVGKKYLSPSTNGRKEPELTREERISVEEHVKDLERGLIDNPRYRNGLLLSTARYHFNIAPGEGSLAEKKRGTEENTKKAKDICIEVLKSNISKDNDQNGTIKNAVTLLADCLMRGDAKNVETAKNLYGALLSEKLSDLLAYLKKIPGLSNIDIKFTPWFTKNSERVVLSKNIGMAESRLLSFALDDTKVKTTREQIKARLNRIEDAFKKSLELIGATVENKPLEQQLNVFAYAFSFNQWAHNISVSEMAREYVKAKFLIAVNEKDETKKVGLLKELETIGSKLIGFEHNKKDSLLKAIERLPRDSSTKQYLDLIATDICISVGQAALQAWQLAKGKNDEDGAYTARGIMDISSIIAQETLQALSENKDIEGLKLALGKGTLKEYERMLVSRFILLNTKLNLASMEGSDVLKQQETIKQAIKNLELLASSSNLSNYDMADALIILGNLFTFVNNTAEASAAYIRAGQIAENPKQNNEAGFRLAKLRGDKKALGEIYSKTDAGDRIKYEAGIDLAFRLFAEHDKNGAEKYFKEIADSGKAPAKIKANAKSALGSIKVSRQDFEGAVSDFVSAKDLDPVNFELSVHTARAMYLTDNDGKMNGAVDLYEEALKELLLKADIPIQEAVKTASGINIRQKVAGIVFGGDPKALQALSENDYGRLLILLALEASAKNCMANPGYDGPDGRKWVLAAAAYQEKMGTLFFDEWDKKSACGYLFESQIYYDLKTTYEILNAKRMPGYDLKLAGIYKNLEGVKNIDSIIKRFRLEESNRTYIYPGKVLSGRTFLSSPYDRTDVYYSLSPFDGTATLSAEQRIRLSERTTLVLNNQVEDNNGKKKSGYDSIGGEWTNGQDAFSAGIHNRYEDSEYGKKTNTIGAKVGVNRQLDKHWNVGASILADKDSQGNTAVWPELSLAYSNDLGNGISFFAEATLGGGTKIGKKYNWKVIDKKETTVGAPAWTDTNPHYSTQTVSDSDGNELRRIGWLHETMRDRTTGIFFEGWFVGFATDNAVNNVSLTDGSGNEIAQLRLNNISMTGYAYMERNSIVQLDQRNQTTTTDASVRPAIDAIDTSIINSDSNNRPTVGIYRETYSTSSVTTEGNNVIYNVIVQGSKRTLNPGVPANTWMTDANSTWTTPSEAYSLQIIRKNGGKETEINMIKDGKTTTIYRAQIEEVNTTTNAAMGSLRAFITKAFDTRMPTGLMATAGVDAYAEERHATATNAGGDLTLYAIPSENTKIYAGPGFTLQNDETTRDVTPYGKAGLVQRLPVFGDDIAFRGELNIGNPEKGVSGFLGFSVNRFDLGLSISESATGFGLFYTLPGSSTPLGLSIDPSGKPSWTTFWLTAVNGKFVFNPYFAVAAALITAGVSIPGLMNSRKITTELENIVSNGIVTNRSFRGLSTDSSRVQAALGSAGYTDEKGIVQPKFDPKDEKKFSLRDARIITAEDYKDNLSGEKPLIRKADFSQFEKRQALVWKELSKARFISTGFLFIGSNVVTDNFFKTIKNKDDFIRAFNPTKTDNRIDKTKFEQFGDKKNLILAELVKSRHIAKGGLFGGAYSVSDTFSGNIGELGTLKLSAKDKEKINEILNSSKKGASLFTADEKAAVFEILSNAKINTVRQQLIDHGYIDKTGAVNLKKAKEIKKPEDIGISATPGVKKAIYDKMASVKSSVNPKDEPKIFEALKTARTSDPVSMAYYRSGRDEAKIKYGRITRKLIPFVPWEVDFKGIIKNSGTIPGLNLITSIGGTRETIEKRNVAKDVRAAILVINETALILKDPALKINEKTKKQLKEDGLYLMYRALSANGTEQGLRAEIGKALNLLPMEIKTELLDLLRKDLVKAGDANVQVQGLFGKEERNLISGKRFVRDSLTGMNDTLIRAEKDSLKESRASSKNVAGVKTEIAVRLADIKESAKVLHDILLMIDDCNKKGETVLAENMRGQINGIHKKLYGHFTSLLLTARKSSSYAGLVADAFAGLTADEKAHLSYFENIKGDLKDFYINRAPGIFRGHISVKGGSGDGRYSANFTTGEFVECLFNGSVKEAAIAIRKNSKFLGIF
ncbi:MAG: hypothetical protein NTZ10_06000 [Candidatus Saganbacteria bacterium]|nr:hypothetical protein [Candidatus Saganbacteria bacterium]